MAGGTEGPARSRSASGKPTKRSSASKAAASDGAASVDVDTTKKAPTAAAPKGRGRAAGSRTTRTEKSSVSDADRDRLTGYYREMTLIREFELKAGEMYTRAKIGGYCHLNLGEEPTVVGVMAALRPTDYIYTNYREHGYALARGMEPGRVMAELFGRSDGVSSGRGGSMHLFDASRRFLGGYGIVGGQIPPATGAALALTYRGKPGPDAEACCARWATAPRTSARSTSR